MKKEKVIVHRIQEEFLVFGLLDYKQLERDRGFLVYLSRVYRNMCPCLKGVHQTFDSWRVGRDKNSWKINKRERLATIISNKGEVELEEE